MHEHRLLRVPAIAAAVALWVLCGCSGGGARGFGYARLQFPPVGQEPRPMDAVLAFPNLTFDAPVFVTHAPDGSDRLFVVEQLGRILVFPNDPGVPQAGVFLDIRSRVTAAGGEEGLLGLAFDPGYTSNGHFYVHYTTASPHQSVIARYTVSADPDRADAESEAIVLTVPQPYANHNAGMLAFGPDGMLYVSLGDGGSGGDPHGNGQDLTTLLGSMLRLDVSQGLPYRIPPDNPLVGAGGGVREEAWAWGLRNPWRFSFDRGTGDLWLGDVGQGMREEIDRIEKGGNYGWNVFEGALPFRSLAGANGPFLPPVLDYGRDLGAAVIGGYVYRGSRLPELHGAYLYADHVSGRVFALVHQQGAVVANAEIALVTTPSSFGEDQDGEVLIVGLGGHLWQLQRRSGAGSFPQLLSQTGLFTDTANLVPAPGVIPYDVTVPLWSDGALKRRWIALTSGAVDYAAGGDAFAVPPGSALVKHFELETRTGDPTSRRRLETRVLLHESGGWAGYTYRWNAEQTDAELLTERQSEAITILDAAAPGGQRTQTWTWPSRTDCLQCHTEAAGRLLGVNVLQLNRTIEVGGQSVNQLAHWQSLRLLRGLPATPPQALPHFPEPGDPAAPAAAHARATLAVNCAMCHRPGAPAPTTFDLRWTTPDAATNLLSVRPQRGDLDLNDPFLVTPGSKERSVLWERMRRLDTYRMPPLATSEVDQAGVQQVGAWIDALR